MAVIDQSVVRIGPDFKGFRTALRDGLKKATAGVTGSVKVKLVADATGFAASVRTAVAAKNLPTVKIKVEADASSLRRLATAVRTASSGAQRGRAGTAGLLPSVADVERQGQAVISAQRQANRGAEQETRRSISRRNSLWDQLQPPKLINLGGEGVKPLNLLYATAAALAPVLVAVASSAVQAGTSIVALGSAAYGGALAVTGLITAFSGVFGALKLHAALQKTEQGQVAKTAAATRDLTAKKAAEKKALVDTAQAYKDAAQKVKDLRLQLSDLRVQQSGNALDLQDALQKQKMMHGDFFATDLMKKQADQAVLEARQRGKDIANEIGKTRTDLTHRNKVGLSGSPEVVQAAGAMKALRPAAIAPLAGLGQLNAALKDLSPAGRDLYNWLVANTGEFKKFKRGVEEAILPGFLSFLKDVTNRSNRGKSAADLFADGVKGVGRQISNTTARLGKLTRTAWFRGSLIKLNRDNKKAFSDVGDATVTMTKPIVRLITAASPLITRLTGYIDKLAHRFADWIATFSGADLSGWFKRAGDELAKWWGIASNLGSILLSIFKASLPSGNDLVTRIGDLTKHVADWAKSPQGQAKIQAFFEYFKNIDYGKIARFAASLAGIFIMLKTANFAAKHPLFTLLGLLAAKYPDATVSFLNGVADATIRLLSWADKHPAAVAAILALVGAYRALGAVGKLKLPSLPGIGGGAGIGSFASRGSTPANPLFVYTVNSGVDLPGIGGKAGKGGLLAGLGKGGLLAAAIAAAVAAGIGEWNLGSDAGKKGQSGPGLISSAMNKPTAGNIGRAALTTLSPIATIGNQSSLIKKFGLSGALELDLAQAEIAAARQRGLLAKLWRSIFDWFVGLGRTIGEWATNAWHAALDFFSSLPDRFMEGLRVLPGRIAYFAGQIVGWIVVGIVKGVPALLGTLGDLAGYFGQAMTWINNKILAGVLVALGFFERLPGQVYGLVKTLPGRVWDGIKATGRFFKRAADASLKFFQDLPGKVIGFISGLPDKIWGVIQAIPKFFQRMWTDTQNFFISGVNAVIHLLNKFLAGVDSVTKNFGINVDHNIPDVHGASPPSKAPPAQRTGSGKDPLAIGAATGGKVPGFSPNSRADNIPAQLTAGEWVHPVSAVRKYGPRFMEAVRTGSYEPEPFAEGGLVGSLTKKLPAGFVRKTVDGVLGKIPQTIPAAASYLINKLMGTATGGQVSGDANVARIAEATARAMGATEKQLIALFETGLVESGMRNLKYGDRDSVGFLQQRPSQGWGSVAQIMDPAYATRKFMEKAMRVDQTGYNPGQLAQAVQTSGYPDRYQKRYADAVAILNQVPPYVAGGPGGGGLGGQKGGRGWEWEVATLNRAGFNFHPSHNQTTGGGHVQGSWHYKGRAVDLSPPSMSVFNWIKSNYGSTTKELIYGPAVVGIKNGQPHNYGKKLNAEHVNHVHWAYGDGGLVGAQKYDGGGLLKPGVTMAVNNTRKPETVRTHEQEQALHRPGRLDRRDLVLLAQYIASAVAGQSIHMDGRKVAETVRGYDYLPRGI